MGLEVKNPLRAQSKYSLMGSSTETGKFLIRGSQDQNYFLGSKHKSAIYNGTPHLHIKASLYLCRRIQGSQIFKQNSIISIHSRLIVFLMI